MHYKNGREAKPGDKVINLATGQTGMLHSTQPGSDTCNGRLALLTPKDPYINIKDCLHLEDVAAAVIPDKSKQ
jgi:hypothetical protein